MPDDLLDMEIIPPRNSPPGGSPRHAHQNPNPNTASPRPASVWNPWQPVPVQPPIARKPVGSSPTSPRSPRSPSSSQARSPPTGHDPWGEFVSSSFGISRPGPYHAKSIESPAAQRPTTAHGRSLSDPDPSYASPPLMDSTTELLPSPASGSLASPPPPGYYPPGYQPVGSRTPPAPTSSPPPPDSPPRNPSFIFRYWLPHYSMYFFLIVGVLFAVGHHLFYTNLHGKDATNQIRLLRYGAALSFLCKASLAAAAVTAFRQRVWMTVRRKVLTLAAVDSLFAATEDIFALMNLELFRQAKLAILLAVYVWCTPLVVIFASDTLAVEPTTLVQRYDCPSIRSLNFEHEGTNDWRNGRLIEGLYELSLSLWNNTSKDVDDPDFFDYYAGPSLPGELVATLASYLKMPIARENASAEICSPGWNCTFTVDFVAPGYKCTELASGVGSRVRNLGDAEPPFDTDILAPTGNVTYIANAFEGEYAAPQVPSLDGGIPRMSPPYPPHLGALRTEPIIWVGYAAVDDPSKPQPGGPDEPGWDEAFTPKIFGCEHYETRYEVDFTYNSSQQHTHVRKREYLRPVIDTTFVRGRLSNDGTLDNTTAVPESNYVLPTGDLARYRTVAAYHSLGMHLRNFLEGTISEPKKIVHGRITQTRLVDPHSYLGVRDLHKALPTLYEDMLLSMLSNPQFLAVVWAADPGQVTGRAKGGAETEFACTRHRTSNTYRYHAADLWAVYSVAIVLCLMAVGYGAYAVAEEGVTRTTRFSSIAAATRGPALEKIPWEEAGEGAPGGLQPVDRDAAWKVKVGYGVVVSKGSNGFGVEGDVVQGNGGGRRRWGF
ncbi:uncharacterized protein DNG_07430 [Cephalotrichum gorgonifer]|uniref:Uncharacterized protein n=1 Tax=Cephalotrichum gorgonifer TaxID=2041049 RepID=A0AAE8N1R4_9PEZI|nr:uncharacterized protein DNG_07430 [Cephalotrichum gorgonifer]